MPGTEGLQGHGLTPSRRKRRFHPPAPWSNLTDIVREGLEQFAADERQRARLQGEGKPSHVDAIQLDVVPRFEPTLLNLLKFLQEI